MQPSSRSIPHDGVTGVTDVTRDSVTSEFVTESHCHTVTFVTDFEEQKKMNHTQRIAHVARQRRSLTKALVREAVERYLEVLAEEITSGEWVDIPYIGKVQVIREEGKGYVTSITTSGQRVRRDVKMRLRTKVRLYEKFKRSCRCPD